ncbi:MAG: NUDIX domain-containing protein [Actinomycetota bacterium]|nr:NUDIX domain-containing protein [Actinomycetota bacterium]
MRVSISARRLGYRLAFRILQVAWFVRRPRKSGVKCLITNRGRILLVRHTYGARAWDLPGGAMKRGEPPLHAARREMQEELGLGDAGWRPAGELRGSDSFRHDVIHCFRADLPESTVRPDPVELSTAQWFAPAALPSELAHYVRPVLEQAVPATGGI